MWAGGNLTTEEYYEVVTYSGSAKSNAKDKDLNSEAHEVNQDAAINQGELSPKASETATSTPRSPRRPVRRTNSSTDSDLSFFGAPVLERVSSIGRGSSEAPKVGLHCACPILSQYRTTSKENVTLFLYGGSYRCLGDGSDRTEIKHSIIHKQLSDGELAARLSSFCEEYRQVFNVKLVREIRLLEGPLLPILMLPECRKWLDFRVRMKYFDLCLSRLEELPKKADNMEDNDDDMDEPIYIEVNRDTILEDTAAVIQELTPFDLITRELNIEFVDEDGIDEGGLTREWYMLVCRAIFKPEYGLFTLLETV